MKQWKDEEILIYLIRRLEDNLLELSGSEAGDEYAYGQKVAYAECLEIIRHWKDARKYGLDYEVEDRFPI